MAVDTSSMGSLREGVDDPDGPNLVADRTIRKVRSGHQRRMEANVGCCGPSLTAPGQEP